ncbi:MAG: Hsp20/alpha crystallin family protein [Planctomycetaceae bacterium]
MPVFRWGHSWDAFRDLEREVDRLLQSVNLTFQGFRFGRQFPPLNLYELEGEFLLTAELPGMRVEDLELTISGGVLTLIGKPRDTGGIPEERYRRQERIRGPWQRAITLPERVQEEKLSAELNLGILKVHLPKAEALTPRQIQVTDGDQTASDTSAPSANPPTIRHHTNTKTIPIE